MCEQWSNDVMKQFIADHPKVSVFRIHRLSGKSLSQCFRFISMLGFDPNDKGMQRYILKNEKKVVKATIEDISTVFMCSNSLVAKTRNKLGLQRHRKGPPPDPSSFDQLKLYWLRTLWVI